MVGSTEDVPTYEGGPGQQQQQQQWGQQWGQPQGQAAAPTPPGGHQASYMNYPPYNMGGAAAQQQQQQQQHPFVQQQQQRPVSARPAGRAGGGAAGGGAHPFEPPPQQQQQGGGQRPRVGAPIQHPFALDPAGNNDPWDRMADDIQKMQIGTAQFNR